MSWRTAERARALGVDLTEPGAHRVDRLRLFAGNRRSETLLPRAAFGLSRRRFDTAMRAAAFAAGAVFEHAHVKSVQGLTVKGPPHHIEADALFFASGKSDIRGHSRPRRADDPAMGIRVRAASNPDLHATLAGAIELHLFEGGYAGIVLQEDGSANICLALRKSVLKQHSNPSDLLERLASNSAAFADRYRHVRADARFDAVAAVPYGYVARGTDPGVFRVGDQAACIPSLAGEGMGLALVSGMMAANCYLERGPAGAPLYQDRFARAARRPVTAASALWHMSERPMGARVMTQLAQWMPSSAALAMRVTRVAA